MCLEALFVHNLHFREPTLPDFAFESELIRELMREPSLDELHGLFNSHVIGNLDQKMDVIGHDNEIMQLEFALCDK